MCFILAGDARLTEMLRLEALFPLGSLSLEGSSAWSTRAEIGHERCQAGFLGGASLRFQRADAPQRVAPHDRRVPQDVVVRTGRHNDMPVLRRDGLGQHVTAPVASSPQSGFEVVIPSHGRVRNQIAPGSTHHEADQGNPSEECS